MDHNAIRHKLSDYIDGSATAREKREIENHLKTCAKCRDALHELQKTVEHIRAVEEVEPPAWMTQKIMAKVRAGAGERKSWYRRLFFPLHIKLPLEAVAMVFLAVTAFTLYQNMRPLTEPAEAPIRKLEAAKEAPLPGAAKDRQKETRSSSLLTKKEVPQAPGYKALDMKPSYEKPAPPVLEDRAAPAPAKPAEQPAPAREAMAPETRAAARQAPVKRMMQEQAGPAAGFAAKKEEAKAAEPAPSAKAEFSPAADSSGAKIRLTLNVQDVSAALQHIRKMLARLEGKIVKQETTADAVVLTATLAPAGARRFIDELKSIGDLKERDMSRERYEETITVEITVTRPAPGAREP